MPGQSGLDFLATLRETHPRLPFILYTGKGSEEVASDAISAGVTDYLQKEIGSGQYAILANRIKNVVASYHAQQEIRDTEQRFAELAANSDNILYSFSGDWNDLLFINQAFETIWGIPPETLKTHPDAFLDGIHPEDQELARDSMRKLTNGSSDEIVYRVQHPENGTRWVHGQSKPILDDTGAVIRIVGYVQDITDYKETQGLRAIETSTEGISLVEPDGTFSYVNPAFADLFGYDQAELIGQSWKQLYHNQDAHRLETSILPAVREHGYWRGETVRQTKAGDRLITDHRLATTDSESIMCTAHDITPERTTTHHPGEYYHLVQEKDCTAFFALDHEGYVTRWSNRAATILGYTSTESLGQSIESLLNSNEQSDTDGDHLLAAAQQGDEHTVEIEWVDSNATTISAQTTIVASYTATGTLRGFGVLLNPTTATA